MYRGNYEHLAEDNANFRKVVYTGKNSQLVLMSLNPSEDIGEEVHDTIDQIFFIVDGEGTVLVGTEEFPVKDEAVVFVPAGTNHNITNSGQEELKLITVYSPPEHADGTVHATKEDALKAEHH